MYRKVRLAREQLEEGASKTLFLAVSVAPENAELIERLRATVHTGPGIEQIRFSKNVADRSHDVQHPCAIGPPTQMGPARSLLARVARTMA